MDEGVHPAETWLPSCVSEEERSMSKDDGGATYTQLKTVCQGATMAHSLKATDVDIVTMEQGDGGVKNTRPHSTPATLLWLEENYETADGVCIPRSTLYMHYVDFCDRHCMQPVNAASFGKIIRQQFPHLTTRRLGTRGQSRYHYYGIAVKECSPYYEVSYSKRGCSSLHESKKESIKQPTTYSQRTKIATLLPDFTNFKDLHLPPNVPEDKVSTFLMMYRTHCQRILDTVIRANFDEVNSFLQHFWRGMPSHISSILNSNAIISMIGVCDSFVYKAISNVLFTSVLQALPDSLIQVVRKFSKDLLLWLRSALESIPENLRALKFDLAKYFSRTLRRQTSLNHLCQASRMVIHNADITAQMLQDWRNVDLDGISRQILFTMDGQNHTGASIELITSLYKEFETLLEDQAPIEAFMEWLESLVDRCVVQPNRKRKNSVRRLARQFLLMWSSFGTRVIRDMTLHSAPSFGSFHLLHLTFDDYILFLVEQIHWEERTQELFANIPTDTLPNLSDSMLDDSVVDSEIGMNKLKWGYGGGPQSHTGGEISLLGSVLQLPSSSPHSHSSSNNDVMGQHSPIHSAVLDPHPSSMNDDPNPENANDARQMDYAMEQSEHYSSGANYHYNGHMDVRYNGYSTPAPSAQVHRQEARAYSCHSAAGHPYVMNQSAVDEHQHQQQQQPDCPVGRSGGTTRIDTLGNGVDYAGVQFVQYSSVGRRGDYGPSPSDNHATYAVSYDQQQQQQQQVQVQAQPGTVSAPALVYATPSSCYYPPPPPPPPPSSYDPAPSGNGCCSPAPYPTRPDSSCKVKSGGDADGLYGVPSPDNDRR